MRISRFYWYLIDLVNITQWNHFIFSYFPPNQTILKPKTLTNISRQSDILKKKKKKKKITEGYLRSDQRCRMKVERLSYCVVSGGEQWRGRMKERCRSERGREVSVINWGLWSVFFKKTPVKWFSENRFLSVFANFQKCFLKFVGHHIFIPKTFLSIFNGGNLLKITTNQMSFYLSGYLLGTC